MHENILAKCINETYIYENDGNKHHFSGFIKEGNIYAFIKDENNVYWLDTDKPPYCYECRGLAEKYFNEMFKIV